MKNPTEKNIDISNEPNTTFSQLSNKTLEQDPTVRFVHNLGSTLDITALIECFARGVAQQVECDYIGYFDDALRVSVEVGKSGSYGFSYNLEMNLRPLGHLRFSRGRHFSEVDIAKLEDLMCFLLQPLANAIDYRLAKESALHDPLTSLANRASLDSSMAREIALAKRYDYPLTVLALDLDRFKKLNDTFGHHAGDEYLKVFASELVSAIRDTDMAFRIGGDEFLVLMCKTEIGGAAMVAQRLRARIENLKVDYKGKELNSTISIGLTAHRKGDENETLLTRVDEALYNAKHNGRNCVVTG